MMETSRVLAVMKANPQPHKRDIVVRPVSSYEEAVVAVTKLNDGIKLNAQPYYVGIMPK